MKAMLLNMLLNTLHKVDPFTPIPVSPKHAAAHCWLTAARVLWVQHQKTQKNMLCWSDWGFKGTGCTELTESNPFIYETPTRKKIFS